MLCPSETRNPALQLSGTSTMSSLGVRSALMELVPTDVLRRALSKLSPEQLGRSCCVSVGCKVHGSNQALWKPHAEGVWRGTLGTYLAHRPDQSVDYRQLFIRKLMMLRTTPHKRPSLADRVNQWCCLVRLVVAPDVNPATDKLGVPVTSSDWLAGQVTQEILNGTFPLEIGQRFAAGLGSGNDELRIPCPTQTILTNEEAESLKLSACLIRKSDGKCLQLCPDYHLVNNAPGSANPDYLLFENVWQCPINEIEGETIFEGDQMREVVLCLEDIKWETRPHQASPVVTSFGYIALCLPMPSSNDGPSGNLPGYYSTEQNIAFLEGPAAHYFA